MLTPWDTGRGFTVFSVGVRRRVVDVLQTFTDLYF
jgi:hypothetical protein